MPDRVRSFVRGLAGPALWGASILCPLIGCASSAPAPVVSGDRFDFPPVRIESVGRHHVVVVESPTPGWEVTLTRVLPGPGHRAAYVTLRRPFPGVIYPQVIVTQRLSTGVPVKEPVRVFARIIDHAESASTQAPFAPAAEAPGK